ncbi:MAG: hypothetical protein H6Q89_1124 [Myxococcaceae bacterium]|nr:hypothetical protein [Myxococcaceae bacterium]
MVPAMSEKKFKVHGCGLTARSIKAKTPEEAARLFQFDVNAEKYRGKFVQEGEIVIQDEHGKPLRFGWDLKPIEAAAKQ